MTTLSEIANAKPIEDFIADIKKDESAVVRRDLRTYDLKLYPDSTVSVQNGSEHILVADTGLADLARLVRIPTDYFTRCDARLQSILFNYSLRRTGTEYPSVIGEIKSQILTKVSPADLIPAPRLPILEAVRESIPQSMEPGKVRIVSHRWNGTFDISVICEAITCEPRPRDMVAFGINVAEDHKGSVQVQAASFRLICRNGAVHRICANNERRLRRPMFHTNRNAKYCRQVRSLAIEAWARCERNAKEIQALPATPIYEERMPELRMTLRNPPFYLPASVTDRVLARLRVETQNHGSGPTTYDLWNAMTFLGTHSEDMSASLAYRLRRSAGELAHHSSRTCATCKQVVFTN